MSTIKKSAVLAAAFVGLFVGSARAEEIVVAKVPFPFVVNGEQLPAGHYEIRDDGEGMLAVLGMDNHAHAFVLAPRADGVDPAGGQPVLVFTRYEGVYRLSEIWESSAEGREVAGISSAEKIGRAETQAGKPDASTVVLVANLK